MTAEENTGFVVLARDVFAGDPPEVWHTVYVSVADAIEDIKEKVRELVCDEDLQDTAYEVHEGCAVDDTGDIMVRIYENEEHEDRADAAWEFRLRQVFVRSEGTK